MRCKLNLRSHCTVGANFHGSVGCRDGSTLHGRQVRKHGTDADTLHVPPAQQHIPRAGLRPERRVLVKWFAHNLGHVPMKSIWDLFLEVGSQRFGIVLVEAERQGQTFHLRVR